MEYMHEYRSDFGQEFNRSKVPQLRTVPIQLAITPENKIATYDDIYQFLKNYTGTIAVANCICRQGEGLLNYECKQTKMRETCITFGEGAKDYIKRGQGRPISSIEAITILDQASKDGLVLQPGNALEPFCICCCCGDCCGVLTVAKKYPRPVELFSTNFYAQIDPKLCSGCGICLKRCQMDAINKESGKTGKAKVNLDRCIGCGLCVPTCPTHAVHLVRKVKAKIPPPNLPLLYVKILMNKPGIKEKIRFIARALVGMPV
jgi:NAD-dependent dihydropyrimidine dehydrogenase PreA subunit